MHRHPAFILPLLMIILLSSCAPQHPKDMRHIEELRARAEGLVKAQALMGYESWAYGKESNQDSLYRANSSLFSLENVALVKRAESDEPDAVQKKRLDYFRRYLSTELISKEVAPLTDRTSNLEATSSVTVAGKQVAYRQIPLLLANEKNQSARSNYYLAQDPVLDSLNAILGQLEPVNARFAHELGYGSFNAMMDEFKGVSLEAARSMMEGALTSTDSLYRSLLREMLSDYLRLDPEHFYRYDTPALFRSSRFDKYFPPASMIEALKTTYRGIGIDLDQQKNLTIDAEVRPSKNPRAVCFPIDVPNDIRLSIKPMGGFDDYSALFHEMGHAEHYASTKEHSFEFKYAGEPTVTETYAFLSEYLLANQAWLRIHGSMPVPVLKQFVRFQAFYRLYFVRRYCAKFLYELQLHAGAANAPALYAGLTGRAVGYRQIPADEKRYLTDVDPNYYSLSYLRAWFLEAQLNAKLTKDFGANWFEHPGAGEFLRSLWAQGDRMNGNELVQLLGYPAVTPGAWVDEIRAMIVFSAK